MLLRVEINAMMRVTIVKLAFVQNAWGKIKDCTATHKHTHTIIHLQSGSTKVQSLERVGQVEITDKFWTLYFKGYGGKIKKWETRTTTDKQGFNNHVQSKSLFISC